MEGMDTFVERVKLWQKEREGRSRMFIGMIMVREIEHLLLLKLFA
jgi:hypothetical protein